MTSILFLSAAFMTSADPAPVASPAPAPAPAPIVASTTGCSSPGCGGTVSYGFAASCCDPCASRGFAGFGILDRVRGRFATLGSRLRPSCNPCISVAAPVVAAPCSAPVAAPCSAPVAAPCSSGCVTPRTPLLSHPLFTGFTSSVCDPCARPQLLGRLRGLFQRPSCGCTSTVTAQAAPCCGSTSEAVPTTPIAPAPATPEPPKVMPKPDTAPKTTLAPVAPLSPVSSAPRIPVLGGTSSSY